MFGLLNVNKPPGPTSHDVVAQLRRLLGKSTKIGHCGTLDPFAQGVLVICLGQATRLAEYVSAWPKQYVAKVVFGVTSTTDDPEGELASTHQALPTAAQVESILPQFVGEIDQVPPAHSAALVGGRRAYKLARAGRPVALQPRRVNIARIELTEYSAGHAQLVVDCSSGTYIRSLARDLGQAAGCGAYCASLSRTRIGLFTIQDAAAAAELTVGMIQQRLQSPLLAVSGWPVVSLTAEQEARVRLGQSFAVEQAFPPDVNIAAQAPDGRLLAICQYDVSFSRLQPVKVFL